MNKIEGILLGSLLALTGVWLLFKAIGSATKYLCNIGISTFHQIVSFLRLAPPWFWSIFIITLFCIFLVYAAFFVLYRLKALKNKTSIVPVKTRNVTIFDEDKITAVSFGGDIITTKEISRNRPLKPINRYSYLSDAEKKVLERMREQKPKRLGYFQSEGTVCLEHNDE
jgi:predicted membrane protein